MLENYWRQGYDARTANKCSSGSIFCAFSEYSQASSKLKQKRSFFLVTADRNTPISIGINFSTHFYLPIFVH
jgi:hypothetical protein